MQHLYARICNYTCIYVQHVYASIFDRNTVRTFAKNTCTYLRSRCCHGCFAFTGAGASLCTFTARLLRQVCRAAAQAHADRQIQSDQVCATDQQKLAATCTGVPQLRAEVPWQSWLAVVHEVTAEQRRPSDVDVTAKYMLYLTRRSLQFGENQIRRILRH